MPGRRPDDGFTLVETVLAMALVAVLGVVSLTLVLNAASVTGQDIRRTAAANLVAERISALRSMSVTAIPAGQVTSTRVVGSTTYTITETSNYLTGDSAASVCTSSASRFAYRQVRVAVTWEGMGSVKPVTGETVRSIGIDGDGLDQSSVGSLAVAVQGYDGRGISGVTVTIPSLSATQVTGSDGCAVFASLAPATYSATVSAAGYIGTANTQTVTSLGLGVSAANITRATVTYDAGRLLTLALTSPGTAYVPSNLPVVASDSYVSNVTLPVCPGSPTSACMTGVPGTAQDLFPAVWTLQAGTCSAASAGAVTVDVRPTAAIPTATLPVGVVTIDVQNLLGASLAGRTVSVTGQGGCSETYALPATVSGGTGLVLPFGTWRLSTTPPVGPTVTQIVTVSTGSPTTSALLTVQS